MLISVFIDIFSIKLKNFINKEGERMKEKLVIIGANDFQNQLILKAKSIRI